MLYSSLHYELLSGKCYYIVHITVEADTVLIQDKSDCPGVTNASSDAVLVSIVLRSLSYNRAHISTCLVQLSFGAESDLY